MLFLRREQAAGNRLPTATIPVFLPTSISAQKMRFTETVDVARHDTLGEFEGMEKDIFAKKTEGDGNVHVAAVEFSALVAAGDGIHGRNLQILGVFR